MNHQGVRHGFSPFAHPPYSILAAEDPITYASSIKAPFPQTNFALPSYTGIGGGSSSLGDFDFGSEVHDGGVWSAGRGSWDG